MTNSAIASIFTSIRDPCPSMLACLTVSYPIIYVYCNCLAIWGCHAPSQMTVAHNSSWEILAFLKSGCIWNFRAVVHHSVAKGQSVWDPYAASSPLSSCLIFQPWNSTSCQLSTWHLTTETNWWLKQFKLNRDKTEIMMISRSSEVCVSLWKGKTTLYQKYTSLVTQAHSNRCEDA